MNKTERYDALVAAVTAVRLRLAGGGAVAISGAAAAAGGVGVARRFVSRRHWRS